MHISNSQILLHRSIEVLLKTGKKIVLNKGVYMDKELNSLIGTNLKSQMLDSRNDVLTLFRPGFFYRIKVQGGSLGTPLMISGTIKANPMKLCTAKVYQNTKEYLRSTRIQKEIFKNMAYDVTMMSLLKTMAKFGPPRNQANFISFERK